MTWYLWVWGVACTLGMGAWALCGVAVGLTWVEKWRLAKARLHDYEDGIEEIKYDRNRYAEALKEARKVNNEFGRISP